MLKKMNINWNARQLAKMCVNGSITFDNAIQRGYVWDIKRKSLLIESMALGYPIPAFYAKRDESKVFDMLDGKQRSSAIAEYFNNEYALEGVCEELEGKYFNDLPEEIRDDIISYSLTVYYFEDITEDEVNEMFYRLNNGKALTAIELTRVKAKSFEKIKEISKHPIFTEALKESQINKYTNEDIVIKALIMLNVKKPSLKNDFIRPYIIEHEITDEEKATVEKALTQVMAVHNLLLKNGADRVAKKLYTRTHLISMIPLAYSESDTEKLASFVQYFFTPPKRGVSISSAYNVNSTSGSNSQYAVDIRDSELREYYNIHFKEYQDKYLGGGSIGE